MLVLGTIGWYFLTMPTPQELVTRRAVYVDALQQAHRMPIQLPTTRPGFPYLKFHMTPEAEYDFTARVLSTRHYHSNFVDHFGDVSPEDLALGWGAMADLAPTKDFRIWQEDRFFKYRYSRDVTMPRDEIISSMANTHIIPANDDVAYRLKHVGKGDLIHMKGALVNVMEPGYGAWSTSLTRMDSGPGACEILWVETLEIIPESP